MQVQVETTAGLERRVTVELPVTQVDGEVEKRLQKAARTVRIDGFRQGKVPMAVVRKRYGDGIRQEVINDVINRSFDQAIKQQQLKTAGRPTIETIQDKPGELFSYVARLEVYPQIEIADLSAAAVEKPVAEVADSDVDTMIDTLRKQNSSWSAVDRAARSDDRVVVDYKGFLDGEAFEGGAAENANIVIGEGRLIPGFEEGLAGLSKGDEKTLELVFPENYHKEELRGKPVQFEVSVRAVEERKLPEIDAEFMAGFGIESGDLEEFRTEVRENMERELRGAARRIVRNAVMEELLRLHPFDVPVALVNEEVAGLKREMFQQYGGQVDIDVTQIPDEPFVERAQRRVRLALIISRIIEERQIAPDSKRVEREIDEIASTYQQPEEVRKYYAGNEQLLQSVRMKVLEDQVVEQILEIAKVDEKPANYEGVLQQAQKTR